MTIKPSKLGNYCMFNAHLMHYLASFTYHTTTQCVLPLPILSTLYIQPAMFILIHTHAQPRYAVCRPTADSDYPVVCGSLNGQSRYSGVVNQLSHPINHVPR